MHLLKFSKILKNEEIQKLQKLKIMQKVHSRCNNKFCAKYIFVFIKIFFLIKKHGKKTPKTKKIINRK